MTMVRLPQWMLREHVRDNDDELEMMEECGCEMEAARLRRICRVQNEFIRYTDVGVARRRARQAFKQEADPFEAMVAPYHQEPPIPPARRRRTPPELMNPKAVIPPKEKPPKPPKPAKPKTRKPAKPKRKKRHMSTATAIDYFSTGTATKGGDGTFEVCPVGNHPAVIVGVIDVGTHMSDYMEGENKPQRQAFVVIQIDNTDPETSRKDGRPFAFLRRIALQQRYGPKAAARTLLQKALGRELAEGEPVVIKEMLGRNIMADIVHTSKGDKTYDKLKDITSYPKKTARVEPAVPAFLCRFEDSIPNLDWLPRWFGVTIEDYRKQSHEVAGTPEQRKAEGPNWLEANVILKGAQVTSGPGLKAVFKRIDDECHTDLTQKATDYIKAMTWGQGLGDLDDANAKAVFNKYLHETDPSNSEAPWDKDAKGDDKDIPY